MYFRNNSAIVGVYPVSAMEITSIYKTKQKNSNNNKKIQPMMHYFHWIFYFQIHRNSVLFGICMQPHSFTQLSLRKSCVALFILFFFICYMFICTNTFYIRDKIFSTWGSLPTALIVLVFQVPKSHEDHEVLPFLGGHLLLEQQQWTCRAVCKPALQPKAPCCHHWISYFKVNSPGSFFMEARMCL